MEVHSDLFHFDDGLVRCEVYIQPVASFLVYHGFPFVAS